MKQKEILNTIKKSWRWVWHSDSILSWVVALAIIFIVVKFIFFPTLSLIMGTSLPLAGVESSSMDHQITKTCTSKDLEGNCMSWKYELCGNTYTKKNKEHINFNEYWETCGNWYETNQEITKETFSKFWLKNGFKKGDLIIVWGRFTPKIGDVIIFQPNKESLAPRPIIHRIVAINSDGTYQTKGDHNEKQLTASNNQFKTDETNIQENQIIGKAIIKLPYIAWVKIWFTDLINVFQR